MEIEVDQSLHHCWVLLMSGILLIVAGIYIIAPPAAIYLALSFMFGLIILLAGIAELFNAVSNRYGSNREWYLMLGMIDIILGVSLAGELVAGVTILRIIVGLWFLLKSISLIGLPSLNGRSVTVIIGGIIMATCALLVLFNPALGHLTVILWTIIAFIRIFNVLLEFSQKTITR